MIEIKVGDYIRTKDGIIDRTERYSYNCNVWHCENGMWIDECETVGTPISDIVKCSQNIIDLIEEGDYVNGIKVLATTRFSENEIGICIYKNSEEMTCIILKKEDIKSIVTKEQFEKAEYKI